MKRKRDIILIISIGFLSLFIISIVTTGQERLSSLTLANIDALTTDEDSSSPCHTAGGFCITHSHLIVGIHFTKD